MSNLPVLVTRRMERVPEQVRYVARPGLGALPTGTGTMLVFMTPQILSAGFLLWAIWWPYPQTTRLLLFAILGTSFLVGLWMAALWLMLRGDFRIVIGVAIAPFTRLTVTDKRVIWTVPWSAVPLLEIAGYRIVDALLGGVDRRGRGDAAMVLVPGDPAADVDGNIHFDRLPDVHRFVDALRALA